ncbi:helix-turn-helix domain-containing protein [Thermofilum sp.]|uniref:helix-turn-helix domain-containing protein n=1 Tax=Thermofilum sp. TaxID=1961369 RepID=UPI003179BB40
MTATKQYYTVVEAAKLLDVSVPTLYRWIRSKKIFSKKVGGKRVVPETVFYEKLLEAKEYEKYGVTAVATWYWRNEMNRLLKHRGRLNVDAQKMSLHDFLVFREKYRPIVHYYIFSSPEGISFDNIVEKFVTEYFTVARKFAIVPTSFPAPKNFLKKIRKALRYWVKAGKVVKVRKRYYHVRFYNIMEKLAHPESAAV